MTWLAIFLRGKFKGAKAGGRAPEQDSGKQGERDRYAEGRLQC